MTDRERTHLINSFERSIPHAENGLISVSVDATKEIMTLLKEQEAIKVQYTAMGGLRYGACPQCDARVDNLVNPKACGFCGQELKWE